MLLQLFDSFAEPGFHCCLNLVCSSQVIVRIDCEPSIIARDVAAGWPPRADGIAYTPIRSKKRFHTAADARVTSASSPPIWLQVRSPKPLCNRLCARSQWGWDCCNFCRPEEVSRRSLCRRSSPAFAPIHPRFVKSLSMRVKLVVSSASNLPKFP